LRKIFLIFSIIIATSCGLPKLEVLNSDDIILAFGDSLTLGVGVNNEQSYPSVLSELSGFEVINSGISGETTNEGLSRLPVVLKRYHPEILILLEGGNDILQNINKPQIKHNLRSMIEVAISYDVQVVLIGVPEKKLFSNSSALYGELAKEYDLAYDGKIIGSLMRSPSRKSDSVHFNKNGYRELAKTVYELLIENGAID